MCDSRMSHPHLTAMAASALSHHNPHHRHHHHPNPAGPSRQASSSQFTRSASTFGTGSGYATPSSASLQMAGNSSQQHLTATHIPPPEKEGFRAMMRNMVQQPKYAVFDVNVTIEALEQVPQTEGVFEARWKFNGKSPAGKEACTCFSPLGRWSACRVVEVSCSGGSWKGDEKCTQSRLQED